MREGATAKGAYAVEAVAYLASCFLSSLAFVILEFGELDLEKASLIGIGVALFALIPFLVLKMLMGVLRWDGPVSHSVGGAIAGIFGFSLMLSHGEAASVSVAAFFGAWGAFAGLIYWSSRSLGKRMILGAWV
jgi:hypothetical protein